MVLIPLRRRKGLACCFWQVGLGLEDSNERQDDEQNKANWPSSVCFAWDSDRATARPLPTLLRILDNGHRMEKRPAVSHGPDKLPSTALSFGEVSISQRLGGVRQEPADTALSQLGFLTRCLTWSPGCVNMTPWCCLHPSAGTALPKRCWISRCN